MQPSEFWRMTPWEWWAEFDAKMDAQDRIEEAMQDKGGKRGNVSAFTADEWARARREHAEKMKAKK